MLFFLLHTAFYLQAAGAARVFVLHNKRTIQQEEEGGFCVCGQQQQQAASSNSSSMSGRRQARAQNKKVGAGFGPSGGGGGGCGSVSSPSVQHVASMLNDLEVGQWEIPLANIRFAEHCRQTSPAAVCYIVDKIRQVGWMPTALPQVTLPGLNDGQIMTAELATTLEAFVLDENHRLLAAREVFRDEPDKTITCTCYREITCAFTKKIISDGKKRRNSYNLVILY